MTPERRSYYNARARCQCKAKSCWRRYGSRGIQFKFASFVDWMKELGPRPSPFHSVDRINNNGHYESGNVRWATRSEQQNNKRPYPEQAKEKNRQSAKRQWKTQRRKMLVALNRPEVKRKHKAAIKRAWKVRR